MTTAPQTQPAAQTQPAPDVTPPAREAPAEVTLGAHVPPKHRRFLAPRGAALNRTGILALAVVALFAASVLLGSYTVTIPDFFRILAAHLTGGEKIPGASFIVMEHKLPRAVVGTLIGAAFGLSGALFQTMLRNPLASPDVIGISYGASAAAVTAIVVFGASGAVVSGAAFAGALAVAALIYGISRSGSPGSGGQRGDAAGSRLILAGVGIAAALHAVVSFLMTRADIRTAAEVLIWLNGSLN
ncbi:MAG TPA: iron chelate uptake ABC transporter family permease subunit, partial [Arthrobacter sp.]|nr:iron chelate uptake ABC transporter family permease subunit [Arthrobacter sp.]